jgi:RimJ/RimL family protein N-acetyltransferase
VRDELETERLLLRRWRPDDLEALARWHVDPELMEHMGKRSFTREEMKADIERYQHHWSEHGFGLFAAEEKATGALIGRIGLAFHRIWPADPEVGWLVDRPWQGQGLATEGGLACLRYGFDELGFERIVSICTEANLASRRVMEKLGLHLWQRIHDPKLDLELLLHVRERSE